MQMIIKTNRSDFDTLSELSSETDLYADSIIIENEDFGDDRIITDGALYVLEDIGISLIGDSTVYTMQKKTTMSPIFLSQ